MLRMSSELMLVMKKLQTDKNFWRSADETWGYSDKRINIPNYVKGVSFAENTTDMHIGAHRIGIDGRGSSATRYNEDILKQILKNAKKEKLIFPLATVRDLLIKSKFRVSKDKNNPVIMILKGRYYVIAPLVPEDEL